MSKIQGLSRRSLMKGMVGGAGFFAVPSLAHGSMKVIGLSSTASGFKEPSPVACVGSTIASNYDAVTPSGTQEGDLMICFLSDEGHEPAPPAGWTQIGSTYTWQSLSWYRSAAFYKIAGASEPLTHDFNLSGSCTADLVIVTLRGSGVPTIVQHSGFVQDSARTPELTSTSPGSTILLAALDRNDGDNLAFPVGVTEVARHSDSCQLFVIGTAEADGSPFPPQTLSGDSGYVTVTMALEISG